MLQIQLYMAKSMDYENIGVEHLFLGEVYEHASSLFRAADKSRAASYYPEAR